MERDYLKAELLKAQTQAKHAEVGSVPHAWPVEMDGAMNPAAWVSQELKAEVQLWGDRCVQP